MRVVARGGLGTAQVLSKVVRGFAKDMDDARHFVRSGMVEPRKLLALVREIPHSAWAAYPRLSREAVERAVEEFIAELA